MKQKLVFQFSMLAMLVFCSPAFSDKGGTEIAMQQKYREEVSSLMERTLKGETNIEEKQEQREEVKLEEESDQEMVEYDMAGRRMDHRKKKKSQ